MTTTAYVDPVTRIEGHMAVDLEINGSDSDWASTGAATAKNVTGANVKGEMYRGFENILKGRAPTDAIEIVQRI